MIELKKFTKKELENILDKIIEKSEKTAKHENDLRINFFKKIEKEVEELKEKSQYEYIIDFKEINIPCYFENYFNERKEKLILKELQKYFYYPISNYIIDIFIQCFFRQYDNIETNNKNKIKFNINILNRWYNIDTQNLYNFFKFFNTISGIDIPKFDYSFYNSFKEFSKKYVLNDFIDFKIYKNGKIELYIKK